MIKRQKQIGFSQRVQLEWLQQTANLVLAGNDKESINNTLQNLLQNKLSVGGTAKRGNREKAITILMKVWVRPPKGLASLRDEGLNLLKKSNQNDNLAIHWGMTMATYPFWSAVAATVGRLLNLQDTAAAAHVQRRIREQYGERETVSRAARRVLRTFVDWKVLNETSTRGVYCKGKVKPVSHPGMISWLIASSLYANGKESEPIKVLLDSPKLFPFQLDRISADRLAAASPRLEAVRHGLNNDLIILLAKRKSSKP